MDQVRLARQSNRVMVLEAVGRRSRHTRAMPVLYLRDGVALVARYPQAEHYTPGHRSRGGLPPIALERAGT